MADDIREAAAEELGAVDKGDFVASLDAATLNSLADMAAALPTVVLHRSARNDGEIHALNILRTLANARKEKINIGDRVLQVLAELQEHYAAAERSGETQPRASEKG